MSEKKVTPANGKIISINGELRTPTSEQREFETKKKLIDAKNTGKILTGEVTGVERIDSKTSVAIVYYDDYKIMIPCSEMIDVTPVPGRELSQQEQYLLTKRLGSEIDYVVKGVNEDKNNPSAVAVGSRKEAMAQICKARYLDTDKDGNPCVYEGAVAEARIVCSTRAGIIVEVFGVETYIPSRELSYQRIQDATMDFPVGETRLVKILSINIDENGKVAIEASVKQAEPNPYIKAMKKFQEGDKYIGKVSMIDDNGVFVALDGGVDVLCPFPNRGVRPTRGTKVTVRITTKNEEMMRLFGVLVHVSNVK